MLAKTYKLTSQDYSKVLKNGKKINLGWVGIVYTTSQNNKPMFGLVVPASVIAKAVQRNQIKRKIYNTVQDIISTELKHNYKVLIRVFRKPNKQDYQKLYNTINDLLC
ncbi:MAG: ribonuclease P protein component [bacterium]